MIKVCFVKILIKQQCLISASALLGCGCVKWETFANMKKTRLSRSIFFFFFQKETFLFLKNFWPIFSETLSCRLFNSLFIQKMYLKNNFNLYVLPQFCRFTRKRSHRIFDSRIPPGCRYHLCIIP